MTTIDVTLDPPNPLTDSQATFNSKSLAFTQALTPWAAQVNTVAGEINTAAGNAAASASTASGHASDAADQVALASAQKTLAQGFADDAAEHAALAASSAASAVNAPGTSATSTTPRTVGTGSLTLTIQTGKAYAVGQFVVVASTASPENYMSGQVTAHNSGTGSLTVNVTHINGSGTFAAWTISVIGAPGVGAPNGANVQMISADLTLTAGSVKFQAISSTAENLCVILPDATTLVEGGALFVIENTGSYQIGVRNPAGALQTVIRPWQIGVAYLKDNSTSSGVWAFGSERGGDLGGFLSHVATATHSGANGPARAAIVKLTSTKAVFITTNGTTTAYAYVLTISGNSISVGAANTFTIGSGAFVYGVRLTDEKIYILTGASGVSSYCGVLTVSGDTVSAGTLVSLSSIANAVATSTSLSRISDTQVLIAGRSSTTVNFAAIVSSIDGMTVTFGTAYSESVGVAPTTVTCALLTSALCVVAVGHAANAVRVRALAISGASLSTSGAPTVLNMSNGFNYPIAAKRLSDTSAVLVGTKNTTTLVASALVVSIEQDSTNAATYLNYGPLSRLSTPVGVYFTKSFVHKINDREFVFGYLGDVSDVSVAPYVLQRVSIDGSDISEVCTAHVPGGSNSYAGPQMIDGIDGEASVIVLSPTSSTASVARIVEVA